MWKLKFEYGCWYAENWFGRQIWSKDRSQLEQQLRSQLEQLLKAAGYECKTIES